MSMRSSDWLWLTVRVFGLFFLAKAAIALPAIPVNAIMLHSNMVLLEAGGPEAEGPTDINKLHKQTQNYLASALVTEISRFLFYGAIGLYLCIGGR